MRFFTFTHKRRKRPKRRKQTNTRDYLARKEAARDIITERLMVYAPQLSVTYNRVAIRNTKSRWGSCSSLGNLNFNYCTAFLPPELCDYVVVHELCHLQELNHAPAFWALVESILPDYTERIQTLRIHEKNLFGTH